MSVGVVVLAVISVARLTRLVVLDSITEKTLIAAVNFLGRRGWARLQGWFSTLITCSWCTSMWIAPPVAVSAYLFGDTPWFLIPAIALTASHITAVTAQWLDPGRRPWAPE